MTATAEVLTEVWKFDLGPELPTTIHMPKGAQVLTVQEQHGSPRLWALVDPAAETEERTFETYGTGHTIARLPSGFERRYVGTFQLDAGLLVFHVFEIAEVLF